MDTYQIICKIIKFVIFTIERILFYFFVITVAAYFVFWFLFSYFVFNWFSDYKGTSYSLSKIQK